MNKKQVIGFSALTALSIAFILCCLFLPLVYFKLCNFSTSETIIEQNFSFIEFTKLTASNGDVWFAILDAAGPMWLTVATISFNILTMVGCVFVFALSCAGLVFAILKKSFSFKNSAVYKLAGFVGVFAILSSIFQIVSFVVLTSLANNLIFFKPLLGCFVNAIIGICIIIASSIVKNKQGLLANNKIRDGIFFLLTAICSTVLAVLFIFTVQINLEPEISSFYGLNQIAQEFINNPVGADYVFGISFYVMILVAICLTFVVIYSLVGAIMAFCGKTTNWLSIRVKRWSIAFLYIFSLLFMFLICICVILAGGFVSVSPEETFVLISNYFFAEVVLCFVLVVLPRFIGVYQKENLQTNSVNDNQKVTNENQTGTDFKQQTV